MNLATLDPAILAEERAALLIENERLRLFSRLFTVTEQAVSARYAALSRIPVARLVWTR